MNSQETLLANKRVQSKPVEGDLYCHKGTKGLYVVVCLTNLNSTNPEKLPTVVYRSTETKEIWSQPVIDFMSKFVKTEKVSSFLTAIKSLLFK